MTAGAGLDARVARSVVASHCRFVDHRALLHRMKGGIDFDAVEAQQISHGFSDIHVDWVAQAPGILTRSGAAWA
jgi:hypothetical protein